MDKNTLVELGLSPPNLVSGAFGGAVGGLVAKAVTPLGVFTNIIVGAGAANYGTDYAIHYVPGVSPGLAGFIVGLTAFALVPFVTGFIVKKVTGGDK